ncbi:MAG: hypothetical protein GXO54_04860 [Chloroflexi bacterium]|nr:hypothetical protein [Chloroflexota bacterium]
MIVLVVLALSGWLVALWPHRNRWRWSDGLTAAAVLLYSLTAWLVPRVLAWAYTSPAAWPDRIMPSRHILPWDHYRARIQTMLAFGAAGLATLAWLRAWWVWTREGPPWLRHTLRGLASAAGVIFLVSSLALLAFHGLFVVARGPTFYQGCYKVWGHRGYFQEPDIQANTIASFRRAFDLGAAGVEMDVLYDPVRGRFWVGRYDETGPQTPLEDVFHALGDRGYFWLDLKTLRLLDARQARVLAMRLRALVDRYHVRERVIVESDHWQNLRAVREAGLFTSFWIFNVDERDVPRAPWAYWSQVLTYQWHFIQGGFSAISLDERFYTPALALALRGVPVHTFTVNDPSRMRALLADPNVRVILSDQAWYAWHTCDTLKEGP